MPSTATPRPSDRFIPLYIVAFFVVISGVLGTFTYVAITTYRGVVTANAYEKGVAYNTVIDQARTQDSLGYTHTLTYQNGEVAFALTAREGGQAVVVETAKVWFFRPTQEGMDIHLPMTKAADGTYRAGVEALPAKGLWEARVYAQTAKGEYQASKRITVK